MKRTFLLLVIPLILSSACGMPQNKIDDEETPWMIETDSQFINKLVLISINRSGHIWAKTSVCSNIIEPKELHAFIKDFVQSSQEQNIIAIRTTDVYGEYSKGALAVVDSVTKEVDKVYLELRNELSRKKYGKAYNALSKDKKKVIRASYPYRVLRMNNVDFDAQQPVTPLPELIEPMTIIEKTNEKVKISKDKDGVYIIPEESAEFPGDVYAWLGKNLRYPAECAKERVGGRVSVEFIVEEDGSITDTKIWRSPDARLSEEALRVVKSMPKWQPARVEGKPVRMRYVLPVMFKLSAPPSESTDNP